MIVGGAIGAVVLIIGLLFLMGGGGKRSRPSAPAASTGRMSPAEARKLMATGAKEMNAGLALHSQAHPGRAGEQRKLKEAKRHLDAAFGLFDRAKQGLPGNPQLDRIAQRNNEKRYDCMKRITLDLAH